MFRFWAALTKEVRIILTDKFDLLFMFLMPLLLVTVVTAVQDSAFQLANNNKISMLVVNKDQGEQGDRLVTLLRKSGMFGISTNAQLSMDEVSGSLKVEDVLTAIFIPENFSEKLIAKSRHVSRQVLKDFGLYDEIEVGPGKPPEITLYYDPILQKNFTMTISNVLDAYLAAVENSLMIELLYEDVDAESKPSDVADLISNNRVAINMIVAKGDNAPVAINASQHNVPAWTIFAMFFMVVSLGANIVKEKESGSFIRLKTMPSSVWWLLSAKMFLYLLVAIIQAALIFTFGAQMFSYLSLPEIDIPRNWLALSSVVLVSGFSAVSYAMLIGAFAKTQIQANVFGAISVIILAALGGIWVPVFMMSDSLQKISWFSPLRQSLDAFYTLFLSGGNWNDLLPSIINLLLFIVLCQVATIVKFRIDRLI